MIPTLLSTPHLAVTLFDSGIYDAIKNGQWAFALAGLINNLVYIFLFAIGVLAVIFIIVGGLQYIMSGGDESRVRSAKGTIVAAVGGLLAALVVGGVLKFLFQLFGLH